MTVALKRQQAAEDAIALSMAKVTTGQKLNRLPPGKIFGMTVTEPDVAAKTKIESSNSPSSKTIFKDAKINHQKEENESEKNLSASSKSTIKQSMSVNQEEPEKSSLNKLPMSNDLDNKSSATISQASIDTLSRLFPGTKLSVLQLVLQRCGQDLLKAIEYFASDGNERVSAFRPPVTQTQQINDGITQIAGKQINNDLQIPIDRTTDAFTLPSLYSTNLHADGSLQGCCFVNVVSDTVPRGLEVCTGFPLNKPTSYERNFFDTGLQQPQPQLPQRPVFHLPSFIPRIPCVQPNCLLCYKFT